jgi:2-keto-4-pentenoate hydratase/2-oxohepta-3-ene-1,7-dioic acid hydratase in catechol pathway
MPRFVHYIDTPTSSWGRVDGELVQPLSGAPWTDETSEVGSLVPLAQLTLMAPAAPTKVLCVGRNYRAHAAELGHAVPDDPLLFLKPPSAVIGEGAAIVYPTGQTELVHHEGELGVVIGARSRHLTREQVAQAIFGYTLVNDVTARDLQRRDVQFTRGKGFDTFAPVGPWVDTDFEPVGQRIFVTVNGALRQDGRLNEMIFSVTDLLVEMSRVMTLEPGDVIATGTPSGVDVLHPGDVVVVEIDGLGRLTNRVEAGI